MAIYHCPYGNKQSCKVLLNSHLKVGVTVNTSTYKNFDKIFLVKKGNKTYYRSTDFFMCGISIYFQKTFLIIKVSNIYW